MAKSSKSKVMMTSEGDVAVVSILESRILDESNVQAMYEEIEGIISKKYVLKMVIDFKDVTHLSSAVIGKIIALHKKLAAEKGQLKLSGLNPVIRKVFEVTKVDKIIEIHDEIGSAVKSFKKKSWFGR